MALDLEQWPFFLVPARMLEWDDDGKREYTKTEFRLCKKRTWTTQGEQPSWVGREGWCKLRMKQNDSDENGGTRWHQKERMADWARRLVDFLFHMLLVKTAPRPCDEAPGMICQIQGEPTDPRFGLLPLLSTGSDYSISTPLNPSPWDEAHDMICLLGENGLTATCSFFLYRHQVGSISEQDQLHSLWQGSFFENDPWSRSQKSSISQFCFSVVGFLSSFCDVVPWIASRQPRNSGRLRFLAQLTAGDTTEAPRTRYISSHLRLSLDEDWVPPLRETNWDSMRRWEASPKPEGCLVSSNCNSNCKRKRTGVAESFFFARFFRRKWPPRKWPPDRWNEPKEVSQQ